MPRPKANPDLPNGPGEKLLLAIARHHALSKQQAIVAGGYATTARTHVEEHLKRLVDGGYLRIQASAEKGIPDHYLLNRRGKEWLHQAGIPIDERTGHVPPKGTHLSHRYYVTWLLIRIEQAGCEVLEMRNEWQLSRTPVKVKVPSLPKPIGYAPDLWTLIRCNGVEYPIAWELDRGVENQDPWRLKTQQMVAFDTADASGRYPFQELFGVDRLRYAIIAAPGAISAQPMELRASNLVKWTKLELEKRQSEAWGSVMFIRPLDPATATGEEILFQPAWAHPSDPVVGVPLIGGSA